MHSTHRRSTRSIRTRKVAAASLAGALTAGVTVVGINVVTAASTNLVANSGFSTSLNGWQAVHATTKLSRLSAGHSSDGAARITALSGNARMVLNDVPQTLSATKPKRTYQVSAWVRSSSTAKITLRAREIQGTNALPATTVTKSVSGAWSQLKLLITTGSTTAQLAVNVILPAGVRGQTLDVDSVSVTLLALTATPQGTSTTATTGASGGTLFGETMWMNAGETWAQTLSRLEGQYGRIDFTRSFLTGMPTNWSGLLAAGPRPTNVSFKASPKSVLTGRYDAQLRNWFASAPTDRKIWWTYFHEPEDDIKRGEMSADDYRAAWRRIVAIADAEAPSNLKATLVLMDWTVNPKSGRDWRDYYAGASYIDAFGWDSYNAGASKPTKYYEPDYIYGLAVKVSKAEGKPFGFSEWGSRLVDGDNGSGRAVWMKASARYMDSAGAEFGAYFDAPVDNEYRLFDQPSKDALRAIMNGNY